jgi:hypothetical protein
MSASREIEIEKDGAEIASEEGFTGTLSAFLEWLDEALVYGGVRVHDAEPDSYGKTKMKVETITAGYSSDEHLLGRVSSSLLVRLNWQSSHRGGLEVFEFPEWLRDETERVWLEPETDVFETVYRVRRVRLYDERGDFVEFSYEEAASLAFQEPDRDINEPDGLLIIRPVAIPESI